MAHGPGALSPAGPGGYFAAERQNTQTEVSLLHFLCPPPPTPALSHLVLINTAGLPSTFYF